MPTISEALCRRLAAPVAERDRARARAHVLDWAACAIGGAGEPGVAEVRRLSAREGSGPGRVVGGRRAGPQAAALANGPAGAVLEMDDVDRRALLHPGPVVIPAALAAAEASGRLDGAAFLDAVVRGYEAAIRIGRAAGPGHYARFHPTGTCGGFGAAAAAASVLGLGERETAWALGNAGQVAGGLWRARHERVHTKALHDGRAAANGVAAALLAADGYAGPLAVLEGAQGFFEGLCAAANPAAVLAGLDDAWRIHEVSFKPHAACRHAHPTIDAVLELRARANGRELEALEVATYADAIAFCDRQRPTTSAEAKFSLGHAAAVAWRFGDATLPRFAPEALGERETAALRERVSVSADAELTARYPAHFGAHATARFADGSSDTALAADAWGDPERPLDAAGLRAKVDALCAWGGMDAAATARLVASVDALGRSGDVAAFSAALPGLDA